MEIADSTLVGTPGFGFASGNGVYATLGSVVTITGCTVTGGRSFNLGGGGGHGVWATSSTIHVLGQSPNGTTSASLLQGGAGGPSGSSGPGGGGDGLVLGSGSSARVFGASLVGGLPGGLPLRVDATSTATQNAGFGPSAFLAGTVGSGLVITANLRGTPSSPVQLLLGTAGMFLQPYPLALGAWTVNPALVVGGLSVPASGLLQVPITVPVTWPGDTIVFGQFVMLDVVLNEVQASNTFTAITR